MPNFQLGKIYKIVDNTNDDVYVGSTCEPSLAKRLYGHVADKYIIRKMQEKNLLDAWFDILVEHCYNRIKNKRYKTSLWS